MALQFDWQEARSSYDDSEGSEIPVVFHTTQLPFYRNIKLVRMPKPSDLEGTDESFDFYLAYDKQLFRLDGSSGVIHDANEYDELQLTAETALTYLMFFCYFLHSDEGNFYILDGNADPRLDDLRPLMDPDIAERIAPPTLLRQDEQGNWRFSAYTLYGPHLVETEYIVYPQGFVEMGDDNPVWRLPDSDV